MKLKLQNIYTNGRKIYLFTREDNGTQKIFMDDTFCPFFYEPDSNGKFTGIDGTKLRKVLVSEHREIRKIRSNNSWESDISYAKRYITSKIDEFLPSVPRVLLLDTEIKCSHNHKFFIIQDVEDTFYFEEKDKWLKLFYLLVLV